MKPQLTLWSALLLALCLILPRVHPQVPGIVNHQGKLLVDGVTYTGTAWFKFALVNADGNETYWSHNGTGTGGSEPDGPGIALDVARGVFSVNLGDVSVPNMTREIPSVAFTNSDVRLRIWVRGGTHGFQLLAPDRRLAAVPYALATDHFTGMISDSQLPTNIARVNSPQTFAGVNAFQGPVLMTNVDNRIAGQFNGDGAGLRHLNAAELTGTLDEARLSANVGLLQANQAWTGTNNFTGQVRLSNPSNHLSGFHTGDGSGLTNLNAASLQGKLPASTIEGLIPSGTMLASVLPQDPALVASGYRQMMSIPAPGWFTGATAAAPNARYAHTAVWDGQEMIVWGGNMAEGAGFLTSGGGIYHPDADQWEVLSTVNAPAARAGHTAVWTGNEMIVWGGSDASGFLDTGARFQPIPQRWHTLTATGSPAGRKGHTATWTGSLMAIWGGRNTGGLLNDGSLYDPGMDRWTSLALPDPPTERQGATAVWTGDRILVWGGNGPAGPLNSGAQLLFANPQQPSRWVPTSHSNAPAARFGHSAVWTGNRMLVWGGVDAGGNALASGASYDPISDVWTSLSETNAPAARFGHNGVWTGTEMVVVNGANESGELASGSGYDPVTARWTPLSRLGAPQPRTDAAAVWSGTEILVFGGRAAGQPRAALQRLAPQPTWFLYRKL